MLSLFIGLLTLVLVLNSVLLILMVLVQLPKKEAGLGMAFGGATADALFGAGSGTVLSRWTKYAAGCFLALALVLSVLRNHEARASGRNIADELARTPVTPVLTPAATNAPVLAPSLPVLPITNLPAPASDAPAPAPANPPAAVPVPAPAPGQ